MRPEVSVESDYMLLIKKKKLHLGQFFSVKLVFMSFANISFFPPQLGELVPPSRVGVFQ